MLIDDAIGLQPVAAPVFTSPLERMRKVAAEVAARHAGDVDGQGRFPAETFAALKEARLLGVMIPVEQGGEGLSLAEIAALCSALGQACGSSGLIYAMHQIKTHGLVMHGRDSSWHRHFMEDVAASQLLLASSTTEGGIGGDLRNSLCAVMMDGEDFRIEKEAIVLSYAEYADAILVTSRKDEQAASSDQVMSVLMKGQYSLEKTVDWNTMGMRGTCSHGYRLSGCAPKAQIFPQPFAEIAAQSMLASSHLLWASVWFGIAADAVTKAQNFVRAEARKRPGVVPPGALRLAEATAQLQDIKTTVVAGLARFDHAEKHADELNSISFAVDMNNVKVNVSRIASEVCQTALMVCGIWGYKNDTPYTLGRNIRDVMSAAIMISNDRILANTSNMLLMSRVDTTLGPVA